MKMSQIGALLAVLFAGSAAAEERSARLFDEVWRAVEVGFFDHDYNGVDWPAMRRIYRPRAASAATPAVAAAAINAMLGELKASHTRLYTRDEPAYYELLGVFLPQNEEMRRELAAAAPGVTPAYTGIGVFTEEISGRLFIRAVLDGGPAAAAGLRTGDELLAVEGAPFEPIRSFEGRAGQSLRLTIRRASATAAPAHVVVTPRMLNGATMFLDAMRASTHVMQRDGLRIGYVHVWSYAGAQYQRLLEETLLYGDLRDADALVLDLREGWGGGSAAYLNLFTSRTVTMTSTDRDGAVFSAASGWSRPVVLLVNEATRSGKELIAYGFRTLGIGPVVGTRTAGAFLGGAPMIMSDGSLLYVAVHDGVVDGRVRIEGRGVEPNVSVPFHLPYAQGADPQRERAVETAIAEVSRRRAQRRDSKTRSVRHAQRILGRRRALATDAHTPAISAAARQRTSFSRRRQ